MPLEKSDGKVKIMCEFIIDVLLLVIGIIIGRGYTLDQIEEGRRQ